MAALIIHKRHGKGQPGGQWVTCTLADLVALLASDVAIKPCAKCRPADWYVTTTVNELIGLLTAERPDR